MIQQRGDYTLDDDRERLEMAAVVSALQTTYWAGKRSAEDIRRSWDNSGVVAGVYEGATLVGFARVVTDFVAIAYLADVFIEPAHRGNGLGVSLTETLLSHPSLASCKWLLQTRDAHEVYRRAVFEPADDRVMQFWPEPPPAPDR